MMQKQCGILMLINTGAKMDNKDIILKYLKEKSNGEEVIAVLQEQKKMIANKPDILSDKDFSLMLKLAKNSKGKIRYHALIILSNFEFFMSAKNFYELCQIAAENLRDQDGYLRQAGFILTKNLNAWMLTLPLITKLQNASKTEVNIFYESFRGLFYKLYFSFYTPKNSDIRRNILKSLEIMLPKFHYMAKFWKDQEEIEMANKIKNEINRMVHNGH